MFTLFYFPTNSKESERESCYLYLSSLDALFMDCIDQVARASACYSSVHRDSATAHGHARTAEMTLMKDGVVDTVDGWCLCEVLAC